MKCVDLSQDDSPCVLHSGPALPLKQPRRSPVSGPDAPLGAWRIQMTLGVTSRLCDEMQPGGRVRSGTRGEMLGV